MPHGPVDVIDQLVVRPGCQRQVLDLIRSSYAPLAAERGLQLVRIFLTPPYDRPEAESEIIVTWQYPSLQQLWIARGPEETDPRLPLFWGSLEKLLIRRTRRLGAEAIVEGMGPQDGNFTQYAGGDRRGVAFVEPAGSPEAGLEAVGRLGLRGGINRGGYTFRPEELTVEFAGEAVPDLSVAGAVVEAVVLDPIAHGGRTPALGQGVKRTILLRTIAGADPGRIHAMEQQLVDYARHLTEMINFSVSRVIRSTGEMQWTHCYEQEFRDVADVTGAYLDHPAHWTVVDRLFHPEAPERIADAFFHSIYAVDRSILA